MGSWPQAAGTSKPRSVQSQVAGKSGTGGAGQSLMHDCCCVFKRRRWWDGIAGWGALLAGPEMNVLLGKRGTPTYLGSEGNKLGSPELDEKILLRTGAPSD